MECLLKNFLLLNTIPTPVLFTYTTQPKLRWSFYFCPLCKNCQGVGWLEACCLWLHPCCPTPFFPGQWLPCWWCLSGCQCCIPTGFIRRGTSNAQRSLNRQRLDKKSQERSVNLPWPYQAAHHSPIIRQQCQTSFCIGKRVGTFRITPFFRPNLERLSPIASKNKTIF